MDPAIDDSPNCSEDPLGQLSEEELRELYDAEELRVFLDIFDSVVTEAHIPRAPSDSQRNDQTSVPSNQLHSLSETIAFFLRGVLPDAPPKPTFSVGRLKTTMQRFYLATFPIYSSLTPQLVSLAQWRDRRQSAAYCTLFWFLWYNNLLVPAMFLWGFLSLLTARVFPYPALEELRACQRRAAKAQQLEDLSTRLSGSSSLGVDELRWIYRFLSNSRSKIKLNSKAQRNNMSTTDRFTSPGLSVDLETEAPVSVDNLATDQELANPGHDLLLLLSSVADVFERVKNIFAWRRPSSSIFYAKILFFGFVTTMILPAQYLSKLVSFTLGFFFWHVVPVLSCLSASDCERIPPLFVDVPTDAEFALEVITNRVATGLPITKPSQAPPKTSVTSDVGESSIATLPSSARINWKKWGGRVATGKTWVGDKHRLLNPGSSSRPRIVDIPSILFRETNCASPETLTFPAQCAATPGLISLTRTSLSFTPISSANPSITVDIEDIYAVKKSGLLRGLSVSWRLTGLSDEHAANFNWVGALEVAEGWLKVERKGGVEVSDSAICSPAYKYAFRVAHFYFLPPSLHRTHCILRISFLYSVLLNVRVLDMFFTSELLEKREGGLGLLWLAATLGSKSNLKRLPRRDVMTADISQLCTSIMQPTVPLALRLTSNLMVGVARVYKVKQEILMTDVTTCFNSLKKMVTEIQVVTDAQIQMAQPALKPSALTLEVVNDPFGAGLDLFVVDWDEYLNTTVDRDDDADDDFNPRPRKPVHKKPPSTAEQPRAGATQQHTLDEHYDHLLSNSLDLSFHGSIPGHGLDMSSSQVDGGLGFDDFGPSDYLDIGVVGDELARELGEGWGASPVRAIVSPQGSLGTPSKKRKAFEVYQDGNETPLLDDAASFSRQLLSQDEPYQDVAVDKGILRARKENIPPTKKFKKTRLLLDARTELSDEELKAARAEYLRGQQNIRQELLNKQDEKMGMQAMSDMLWGPPRGIEFWQENFKVQVEARTGVLHIHQPEPLPAKRRKIAPSSAVPESENVQQYDIGMPVFHEEYDAMQFDTAGDQLDFEVNRLRSSEEPGQGRNASRPPSVFGDLPGFPFGNEQVGSQRSSLFPWDNAGASSSVYGADFIPFGSARQSLDGANVRLGGSSRGRRSESLVASNLSTFSPAIAKKNGQLIGEDYVFDLNAETALPTKPSQNLEDSQRSEINLAALDRNSLNFLEYTRMQYQTLAGGVTELTFDDVVPKASSRHVATAAFYHCLVLSTKKLLRVRQETPYGRITIATA
ncbi:hypothetical protein ONZ45_g871 [Pleurotus djamor]|nr:hypothetical protein ONZ45_g871 [Pleurotus djamor]